MPTPGPVQYIHAHLDFASGAELRNVRFEALSAAPGLPTTGQIYWSTLTSDLHYFDGTTWQSFATVASVNDVTDALAFEITRATDAEAAIVADIQSLTQLLSDEVSRATAAEGALADDITAVQTALDAAVATLTAAVAAEEARATAAEQQLATGLAAEATTRAAADTALQSEIDDLVADLAAETAAREAADAALAADIADVASAVSSLDGAFASDAELAAAVAALEADIAAEATARAAADASLQSDIDDLTATTADHEARLDTVETTYATKAEVDAAIQGLDIAESVKAVLEGIVDSPFGLDGTPDAVVLSEGDRVLVKGTAELDGIWVASSGPWSSSNDVADLGTFVFVEGGEIYGSTGWVLTDSGWRQFSGAGTYIAGDGIQISGNVVQALAGFGLDIDNTGYLVINRQQVPVHFNEVIGDGTATTFNVDHGRGTDRVVVSVTDTATGQQVVAGVRVVSNNIVEVSFITPPTPGQFEVTVIAS